MALNADGRVGPTRAAAMRAVAAVTDAKKGYGAVKPRCYCDQAPRDEATGQPRFRCNVCVNAIVDEKNRLVREERCLPERLAGEFERGRRYGIGEEGARILGRIRDGIASWRQYPADPESGMVIATLEVLSTCITHRGISRDDAVKAALDRTAPRPG